MSNRAKYWMISAIYYALLACLLCSCRRPPDGNPPIARRHFTGMRTGSIGPAGSDGLSRCDAGKMQHPRLGVWGQFVDASGEPVDIGGVRMDSRAPGDIAIEGIGYTDDRGYCAAYGNYDASERIECSYYIPFAIEFYSPRAIGNIECKFARVGGINTGYYENLPGDNIGEYYASGSNMGDGEYNPRQIRRTRLSSVPVSVSEIAFLSSEPNTFDDVVVLVKSELWYMAKRVEDDYIPKSITEIYVLDHNNSEVIASNSTPYFADWCFQTTGPVLLNGQGFQAVLKDPNNVEIAPIKVNIIADSNDLRSHVARSGFIVPVDPNGFAPYTIITDGIEILVVPIQQGSTFRIDIEDRTQFVPFVWNYWMANFKPLDINGDGIVNLKDWDGS